MIPGDQECKECSGSLLAIEGGQKRTEEVLLWNFGMMSIQL